ncbi:MAG: class I SAM-dependent methyltransferase, partial [Pirellulaceae bacterium]
GWPEWAGRSGLAGVGWPEWAGRSGLAGVGWPEWAGRSGLAGVANLAASGVVLPDMKSTVSEIRARFDSEVERFSNLETGQAAAMDAPLALQLVASAAAAASPAATRVLDVGCGAGNFTLRVLPLLPVCEITLIDLSDRMLARAQQRIAAVYPGILHLHQLDVRDAEFSPESFDIILAGAVLHHLRTDAEWESVFASFYRWLAPGGSLWIFDLVAHENPAIQLLMERRYSEYLRALRDETYRDQVLDYIAREDTPRSLAYQLERLRRAGFAHVDVLHFQTCFAAWGGVKPRGDAAPSCLRT